MLTALLRPILNLGGFAVLALGLAAVYFGYFNSAIYVGGSSTPQRISIEELGKPGTSYNTHVTITDFGFDRYIATDFNLEVWLPVRIKSDRVYQKSPERPIIVYLTHGLDSAEISDEEKAARGVRGKLNRTEEVTSRPELTGILTSGIKGADSSQIQKISEIIGDASIHEALTLQVDKPFPGFFESVPCFLSGILLVAAAGVMWFLGSKL